MQATPRLDTDGVLSVHTEKAQNDVVERSAEYSSAAFNMSRDG